MSVHCKTYKVRLFPAKEQITLLYALSNARNKLWNKLLETQQQEHSTNNRIHSKYDLHKFITAWRNEDPELELFNAKACQTVANELFASYRSFFNLIKKDPKAKSPGFIEDITKFHTISYNQSGWSFKPNNVVVINKIPLQYKASDELGDLTKLNLKHTCITYRNGKWLWNITVEFNADSDLPKEHKVLAFDLGVKVLGTGVDNLGEVITIPNQPKKINRYFSKHINDVKSKQSKASKGSRRWKHLQRVKKKLYNKKNSQIKQALHIQSKRLSNMNYKTIVVGDLTVKQLMSTEGINANKKGLRKSFAESNISMFLQYLTYKCVQRGTDVIKIDERCTTQLNSLTGKMFKEHIPLNQRTVEVSPGRWIDRDLNSAINILKRYESQSFALVNTPLDFVRCIDKHAVYQEAIKFLV